MMGIRRRGQWLPPPLSWFAIVVAFVTFGGVGSEVIVKFVKTPQRFSAFDSAAFEFEVLDEGSGVPCGDCAISCKVGWGSLLMISTTLSPIEYFLYVHCIKFYIFL